MKMLRIAVLGAVLFAAFSAGTREAFSSAGPKIAAVAVNIIGTAQVKRAGESAYGELKINDMLYPGDSVKTGAGSKVSMVTKGGAEVRLNENSTFEMEASGKVREMLKLGVGQLWTRMLHRMAKVNVRTPSAVCAIRGTEADIEQRSLLTVKVYEGHVDVQNDLGKQALKAGQMTTVAGAGSAPEAARKMNGGEAGNWQDGVKANDYEKFLNMLKDSADSGKALKTQIKMPDGSVKTIEGQLKKK